MTLSDPPKWIRRVPNLFLLTLLLFYTKCEVSGSGRIRSGQRPRWLDLSLLTDGNVTVVRDTERVYASTENCSVISLDVAHPAILEPSIGEKCRQLKTITMRGN